MYPLLNEGIDNANGVVLSDRIVKPLRQQVEMVSVLIFNETLDRYCRIAQTGSLWRFLTASTRIGYSEPLVSLRLS